MCQRLNLSGKSITVLLISGDNHDHSTEILDELLKDFTKPEDLVGEGGILKQLTKALVERCLNAEMDVHLDDPKYKTEGKAKRDRRNGHSQKTLKGEFGEAVIDIPRDRNGEFEPIIVKKGQTRFEGFGPEGEIGRNCTLRLRVLL